MGQPEVHSMGQPEVHSMGQPEVHVMGQPEVHVMGQPEVHVNTFVCVLRTPRTVSLFVKQTKLFTRLLR